MPRISSFYGVVIAMYWDDHGPPHFHARYAGRSASITLNGELLAGGLAPRALQLVLEWTALHRDELDANWQRAIRGEPLSPIAPLP